MASTPYRYKRFLIDQTGASHPSGTDGVLLGAWSRVGEHVRTILDIGTGTGIVALFLAQRSENYAVQQIIGVEIQADSAACARQNFKASPWANRLNVIQSGIQDFSVRSSISYDLIVSNPPFFSHGPSASNPSRHFSRNTDTLPPEDLVEVVRKLLAPRGTFCLILPPLEGQRFCEIAACKQLYFTRITEVFPRKGKPVERLLLQFERQPHFFERSQLTIYEKGEQPTREFIELTQQFYLNY